MPGWACRCSGNQRGRERSLPRDDENGRQTPKIKGRGEMKRNTSENKATYFAAEAEQLLFLPPSLPPSFPHRFGHGVSMAQMEASIHVRIRKGRQKLRLGVPVGVKSGLCGRRGEGGREGERGRCDARAGLQQEAEMNVPASRRPSPPSISLAPSSRCPYELEIMNMGG